VMIGHDLIGSHSGALGGLAKEHLSSGHFAGQDSREHHETVA
jgi:hypothetical protein